MSVSQQYINMSATLKKRTSLLDQNTKRCFHIKKHNKPFKEIYITTKLNSFTVPILGSATAGIAKNYAQEDVEGHLKIPNNLIKFKDDLFALRIEGDSMNRAYIKDVALKSGDFAIIDPQYKMPKNGDYVLSIIDGCANIKKFKRDANGIQLISESTKKNLKPIFVSSGDDYMINGKVIAAIKK